MYAVINPKSRRNAVENTKEERKTIGAFVFVQQIHEDKASNERKTNRGIRNLFDVISVHF